MYTLVRYPGGIIVEAVVLAQGKSRMRIAAPGFPDIIELRRSGTQWFTADRQPVEFDFLTFSAPLGSTVSATATSAAGAPVQ